MKITAIDEHHEALLLWEEALSQKKISKQSTLLHVDAHSDLRIPRLTESVYSHNIKGFVQRQLYIADFIIPAIMRGLFSHVIYLGRGLQAGKAKKQLIGSLQGKGLWLRSFEKKDKKICRLFPDLKEWDLTMVDEAAEIDPQNVVLDIDLDYFCGYYFPQPQTGLKITNAQLNSLKKASTTQDQYRLSLFPFSIKNMTLTRHALTRFEELMYNNSLEWIECSIQYFVDSLRVKPQLVSICRSVKTGYVPLHLAEIAEKTLKRCLLKKEGLRLDPCSIDSPFTINPFVVSLGAELYNSYTNNLICLNGGHRDIWKLIQKGKNFPQIFESVLKKYRVSPLALKAQLLKFILMLKRNYFLA